VGFLDQLNLKPAEKLPQVTGMTVEGNGRLVKFTWDDGAKTELSGRMLRQVCPCAACVDEWTHKRTFTPESIPADVTIRETRPVGNYALGIQFSDGHSTGIFNWKYLREVTERGAAAAKG
jgi:DUF971 family protein